MSFSCSSLGRSLVDAALLAQVLLGDSSSQQSSVADLKARVKNELATNGIDLDKNQDMQLLQLHLQKDDPDCMNDLPRVSSLYFAVSEASCILLHICMMLTMKIAHF